MNKNVHVILPLRNLVWDEASCVGCGACVGQCPSAAFTVKDKTQDVVFTGERCIACKLCIPACSYGAVELVSHHLRRTGEIQHVQDI
jgi:L-aspartate semialdehyde sulfurtransferase ferredoxin